MHHSVFVDLGGLAPPLSVNYTASFRLGGSWKLMGRTGFTYYLLGKPRSYLIPLEPVCCTGMSTRKQRWVTH